MLDKPDFVGSYEVGDYVYFFFRETAVEYMNCGKTIYSRIARVCKKDTGGKNILLQNWATFLKARLNCSIPGNRTVPHNFILIRSCPVGTEKFVLQLNKCETDPYFLQNFQCTTMFISVFCKSCEPMLCEPEIVQKFCS